MSDRYVATGVEGASEPGSAGRVLRNLAGIMQPEIMHEAELLLLERLYRAVLAPGPPARRLTVADLQRWHYRWLGNVYAWAGMERSVNLSRDGFHFAPAARVPELLQRFQQRCLDRYTPAHGLTDAELVRALAVTHVELILVHPFREGNGRLARLLADVMAVQAGRELLDYSAWDAAKMRYFAAIQQGVEHNYEPMAGFVAAALGL